MKRVIVALSLLLFLVGCDAGSRALPPWTIAITSDDLSPSVDNALFALPVGATWRYETQSDEGLEVILVEVLAETKEVWGTTATVVRNTVTLEGELSEDTWDWYAQDTEGKVWYLGEETCEYENTICVNKVAAWEAGVQGALPGIAMLVHPQVGDTYYQEYFRGQAENEGEVVELDVNVTVPAGSFGGCVKTRDTTKLAPDLLEYKTYCPGAGGVALEQELASRVELVAYDRLQD